MHAADVRDPRLARIVRACQEIPGQHLFQYVDTDGERRSVGSAEVNEYIRAASKGDFTAKDFRTWTGTMLAAETLGRLGQPANPRDARLKVARAIETVASALGNTPAVCRSCYVHPAVVDAYMDGRFVAAWRGRAAGNGTGLRREKTALLSLLRAAEALR